MASSSSFSASGAPIFLAVRFADAFRIERIARFRKVLQWVVVALLLLFGTAFLGEFLQEGLLSLFLALLFFAFALLGTAGLLEGFGNYLKTLQLPEGQANLAAALSYPAARAYWHAKQKAKGEVVPSSLFLLHLLKENPQWRQLLLRALLQEGQLQELLKTSTGKDRGSQEVFAKAAERAAGQGRKRVRIGDLLVVLAQENQTFKSALLSADLFPEDIAKLADWLLENLDAQERGKRFWLKENLRRYGSIGRNWTSGFALTLERFSRDITQEMEQLGFPEFEGHAEQLEALERNLSQAGTANALLVGEDGGGKRNLVRQFAGRSALGETNNPQLRYQTVLELDISGFLAQVPEPSQREPLLQSLFNDVLAAGNVVLAIDNFHQYVGGEAAPGTLDITGILASYLKVPSFKFIALTNYQGLHQKIEQRPGILAQFGKIEVPELTLNQTLHSLLQQVPWYEARSGKYISYPALKTLVALADRYITDAPFPKKAEELLEEAMAYLAQTPEQLLLPSHVERIVGERTQIPIGKLQGEEREKLLNLEALIHERLINQEHAVSQIASSLRRARTQVGTQKGPMGSFLFLGPTGVGKTETAKTLAEIYFGSESRMIRLDMSEFQNVSDIPRLLGGKGEEGLLTTQVRENPFSLVLLDELEKAHSNIHHLFLQVLDEGYITDGLGRKVDFRNTIVIATSNAGYKLILQALQKNENFQQLHQRMLDHLFAEGIFRPEFINRFTAVAVFAPLSKENLLDIAELMLRKVAKNLFKNQGAELAITERLKEKIVELGYNPTFGARQMNRVIQEKIENALAVEVLKGKVERGSTVEIDPVDFSVRPTS